jgi:pimeloyl-ACP methyl ester carboxylesterase
MERAVVDGIVLFYAVSGTGEPIVFVHGAFIADAFRPLVAEPSLRDNYRLITYRRRGYGGSTRTPDPVGIARQAADCRALLRYLGVAQAHVVAHSYGGCVALQLALDAPEMVHSLALLEPALAVGESGQQYRDALARNEQLYREAGAEVAVEDGFRARWSGYSRGTLEQALPGAFAQAVADAATTFEEDTVGLREWRFGEAEARRITQPVLSVLGGGSDALWARFGETHRLLLSWLPDAEGFVLPDATHFLHVESPARSRGLAEALADFFGRHPIRA